MELTELKNRIIETFSGTQNELENILQQIENDESVFPFNEYEHLICSCLDKGGLSYQQYLDIRTEYINANPNLWIFEISAPRGFGEKFAQTYVMGKCSKLQIPSKKLDKTYNGEYDLRLGNIKIEVKASRAVDSESEEPLYMKAVSKNTNKKFLMNFQRLKPQCCDVFIWVAVFRDAITLWVLSSQEVATHSLFSKGQHRGNKGNEGQMHINHDNIHLLNKFKLQEDNLEKAILKAFRRNKLS